MKKAAAALIVILVVSAVALPPLLGGMAEESLARQVEEAPLPPYLEIRVDDYERGWFGSRATIEVRLAESFVGSIEAASATPDSESSPDAGSASGANARVRIVSDISHGPVGFSGGPFVGLASGTMRLESTSDELEELRDLLGVPYLVEGRYRLGLGGATHISLDLPAVDFQDDALLLETSGASVRSTYNPRSRRVSGEAIMESFEITDSETSTRIESIRMDVDGTLWSPMLMLGTYSFETDRISIQSPFGSVQRTVIAGLEMSGDTELADDGATFASVMEYGVDSVLVDDQALRDARMRAAARNVDVEVVEAYGDFYEDLLSAPDFGAEEMMADETMADDMMGLAYDLFAASPVFEVESLSFQFGGETFRASGIVEVDGAAIPERSAMDMEDPELWLGAFSAGAELEASKAMVLDWAVSSQEANLRMQVAQAGMRVSEAEIQQAAREQGQELIAAYLAEGYLVENPETYETRIRFEDGALSLNGQPLEMP